MNKFSIQSLKAFKFDGENSNLEIRPQVIYEDSG